MRLNRLTAVRVQQVRKPGFYPDGGGLYLQVTAADEEGAVNKSWLFRFSVPDASKPRKRRDRWAGLGPIGTVSLVDARAAALEARQLRRSGIDPIEHRKAVRAAQTLADAKAMTFDQCRDKFIATNKAAWRNEKHRDQWTNTLKTYATPVFGTLPVAAVDTALVMKVLEPIWATKPETASRVRQRIERVLSWAKVSCFREGDNPAAWRGHLDHLLPARSEVRKVEHHAALPYDQVGTFIPALRERTATSARALEFAVLTAARTGEVIGARWDEIDLQAKTWTVPAERMKGDREHRVPLSVAALAVLEPMQKVRKNDYVFAGERRATLSNTSMLMLLRRMNRSDLTAHGFRSTFRTWAAEHTSFPREVIEMALAHVVGDATEQAYQRGDLFDKRRSLMDSWAEFCAKPAMPVSETANVTPIRKA